MESAATWKSKVKSKKLKDFLFLGLKVLQMVGLFKRQSPAELNSQTLEDARVELENLHLLQGEDSYQLHQLIRELLRDKQNNLAARDEQKYNYCVPFIRGK